MHPIGKALEKGSIEEVLELVAPTVVFKSPVSFRPHYGREELEVILGAVSRVIKDFRYDREIGSEDASDRALVFSARVGDRELEGCDFIHVDGDGLVDELTVMIRPLSAALAFTEAMEAEFPKSPAS